MNLSKLSSACLLAGAGWTGLVNAAPCGGNLLTNPGFEQGGAGWSLASAEVVPGGHDGQSSLFYQNHNPANYHNMVQTLAVKPGQQVAFGVWVRGENLKGKGENQGASVFIESYDDQGRFLAGSYPQGVLGTSGWQPVTGDIPRQPVPPAAEIPLAACH